MNAWLRSPGAAVLVTLVAMATALVLWLVMPIESLRVFLKESGPVETTTAVLHFVIAAAVWRFKRPDDDWRDVLAVSVMFAAFGARELDLHREFTDGSVLKVSFYLRGAPLLHKLVALPIVLTVAAAALHLVWGHARPLARGVAARHPLAVTVVCFFIVMSASKVFDRSVNILAEDYGIRFPEVTGTFITSFEEVLEFFLPVIAALGIAQHRVAAPLPRRMR